MNLKIKVCTLITILAAFIGGSVSLYAGDYKIITDMDDRRIRVPVNPQKIVSIHGPSSERVMILGKGSSMAFLAPKPSPWAYRLFPEIRNIRTITTMAAPNIEEMIKEKVDLLIYSPVPVDTKKLNASGISTACGFSAGKRARNINDFITDFKRQISFLGKLLGPEAKQGQISTTATLIERSKKSLP